MNRRIFLQAAVGLLSMAAIPKRIARPDVIEETPRVERNPDPFLPEQVTIKLHNATGRHLYPGDVVVMDERIPLYQAVNPRGDQLAAIHAVAADHVGLWSTGEFTLKGVVHARTARAPGASIHMGKKIVGIHIDDHQAIFDGMFGYGIDA